MGRDNFPVSPGQPETKTSNNPLIVEDTPRIRRYSCFLVIIVLVVAAAAFAVTLIDPVELNIKLLAMKNPDVKRYAIKNLAREGDSRAVGPLVRECGHPYESIRIAAVLALGEIGSHDAIVTLEVMISNGKDYDLSYCAVKSLLRVVAHCADGTPRGEGCPDDRTAVELVEFLKHRSMLSHVDYIVSESLFDEDVNVRILAAQILAHIATEGVRGSLEDAREDEDGRVRKAADRVLTRLGDPPSTRPEPMYPDDILHPPLENEYHLRLPLNLE